MKKKKTNTICEILVPAGYELTEIMDTDDSGYDFEDAVLQKDIRVQYERDERSERV